MSNWVIRIAFLALTLGGGILIGTLTAPGNWYAQLSKPAFNPPNWIFGPVWTVLYVLIAMVGWRQFETDRSSTTMKLWWTQLGLNFLWSPTFFVLQMPWLAFAIIFTLLIAIVMFITQVRHTDRVSAHAFLPYLAWVAFATVLNLSIAILN
ncbi:MULTISPECIES: TspO/MBR family protein [unclassified Ruegeria]|uniref:TspO/MBR family protein n=1 Tax=unclassified Ruegeria TaxID=2625375 RepID=UPI001488B012|nr:MULTISPECIES: TspO/MBR family protein [unclassified Ruegeria]